MYLFPGTSKNAASKFRRKKERVGKSMEGAKGPNVCKGENRRLSASAEKNRELEILQDLMGKKKKVLATSDTEQFLTVKREDAVGDWGRV